ncbi:MAG: 16S rRNA (cytidine(1402)-2'-O)-methyltransferase [Magnetospirillum sp.]|nr:16S rRNA (cytidine(1402)-2'-O)-methyltransferase [Magnetospirillum sp.]
MTRQRRDATDTTAGAREPSQVTELGAGQTRPPGRVSKPPPGLYLVATPIGNLGDITLRALDVLASADLVACEDTRMTGKLMTLLGLSAPLTPYHDHNAEQARPALLARLRDGAVVALVSDAGTPLVSDPGWRLVRACIDAGLKVTTVPGASSTLAALQLSGLPADRFLFGGFLPRQANARRAALRDLRAVPATLILLESPNRLADSLADMAAVLGSREAAVARELTKLHEEVVRGDLFALANRYAESGAPKGEVVVVIAPPSEAAPLTDDDVDQRLRVAVDGGASVKDAAALVAAESGFPRRDVYARALRLFRMGNA